ncbi:DNA/RNA helicase domain-containing protein [Legionella cardiaca]|uniref:DUF2075 domain-containing protein n=1 Tax=Legionella cardiaca TaxID=1071983 RepID=A0ABY8AQP4_9GAMM|nr:DNA/RNA helicase domain-containing protein [Legionella cardiaca]WED42863.1 DUF2075 domain-containing protein [Legionella cardiaca]
MSHILFDQNRIAPEIIEQYLHIITRILSRELRYPQVKKLAGMTYHNQEVFRAKTDKKERIIYTYTQHQGEKTLLILRVLDDHNYKKVKQQLRGEATVASHELEEKPLGFVSDDEPAEAHKLIPSVGYNQMTLILDDSQQQALQQKAPLILAGVPGAGKTVLLYNLMLRTLAQIVSEREAANLFISQSESLLNSLKTEYEQSALEQRETVQFATWNQLLKAHYPHLKQVSAEDFKQWLNTTKLKAEPAQEVHYEFSLIAALGIEEYEKLANRQSYYSDNTAKKKELIRLGKVWQKYLDDKKLFDPMVTRLDPAKNPSFDSIFCDEAQNLPPVALLDFILYAKDKRLVVCLDTEQCLLSSPFIYNCLKTLLRIHYGTYNEHALSRTWRCPPNIIAVAEYLMDRKHQLASGQRRLYHHIKSAHSDGGVITWVNQSGFAQLSQHGSSASTVVLAENLVEGDRSQINKELGTNNLLTASQAIGLDFNIVILWKPLSTNPHLWSLYQKWQKYKSNFEVSLDEINAINSLYVALTRSQQAVFIYEKDERALRFGEYLLGTLALNQFLPAKTTGIDERKQWEQVIEHHLVEKRFDVAKELMKFHLNMDESAITQRIKDAQSTTVPQASQEKAEAASAVATPLSRRREKHQVVAAARNNKKPEQGIMIADTQKAVSPETSKTQQYIVNLLKNPSEANLNKLFTHSKISTFLFNCPLESDMCLFQALMVKPTCIDFVLQSALTHFNQISFGLATELIKQSKSEAKLFFMLASTQKGCAILLKLLTEQPSFIKEILPDVLHKLTTTALPFMINFVAGQRFLNELADLHPEFQIKLSAELQLQFKEGKTSVFTKLIRTDDGLKVLLFLLADAPFGRSIPLDILKGEESAVSNFCILCSTEFGIYILDLLLEKRPDLLKTVNPDMFFKRSLSGHDDHAGPTPFMYLSNASTVGLHCRGRSVLRKLFTANHALAKAINKVNFSLPPGHKLTSPLFGLAESKLSNGRGLLNYLINECGCSDEIAQAVSAEALCTFYTWQNSNALSALYWLSTDSEGVKFLMRVFEKNPEVARGISAKALCAAQPAAYGRDANLSPIYLFSTTPQGCQLLNKLIELNPHLAREITAGALCLTYLERTDFNALSNALYYLANCSEGRRFLTTLLALNPEIFKNIHPKELYIVHLVETYRNYTVINSLAAHPEGCEFLNKLFLLRPSFAKEMSGDTLLSSVYYGCPQPLFRQFANNAEGIKCLATLLEVNPDLFKNKLLDLFSDTQTIYKLASSLDGCRILNQLLMLNPTLVQSISQRIFPSSQDNQAEQLLKQLEVNPEGQRFLAKLTVSEESEFVVDKKDTLSAVDKREIESVTNNKGMDLVADNKDTLLIAQETELTPENSDNNTKPAGSAVSYSDNKFSLFFQRDSLPINTEPAASPQVN